MDLTQEQCKPCKKGEGKLASSEAVVLMGELDNWTFYPDRIEKRWDFPNFTQALALVAHASAVAHRENHHPDIHFGWGYVEIVLTTHRLGGLSRNDFIVAAKIDAGA
ncbi:MAG: 4a-hydroxytetrahydrobiopterin dehydratase [Alphaproteobacteria bacterium]|nr:4a-hydroxytetrahydrobiopterin dehydratase [Alphaproteobacteria bacterium]